MKTNRWMELVLAGILAGSAAVAPAVARADNPSTASRGTETLPTGTVLFANANGEYAAVRNGVGRYTVLRNSAPSGSPAQWGEPTGPISPSALRSQVASSSGEVAGLPSGTRLQTSGNEQLAHPPHSNTVLRRTSAPGQVAQFGEPTGDARLRSTARRSVSASARARNLRGSSFGVRRAGASIARSSRASRR